jgi:hypothetical protein
MAKFNIYKIERPKEKDLLGKLESVGLFKSGQKIIDNFTLSFYLSRKPEDIDI